MINVLIIPMLSDNFCYYVYKTDIQNGFFVDVSQPDKLDEFIKTYGIEKPTYILTTHKHQDHSGGNAVVKETYPELEVVGGAHDSIPACTKPVNDGDKLTVHGISVTCLHTPCHTKGHILYYCQSDEEDKVEVPEGSADFEVLREHDKYQHVKNINRCLFTGDTIFVGGCGKFFEGTADQMLSAMDRVSELPKDTKIFCGHEYTVKNLEFAALAEPDNKKIEEKQKFVEQLVNKEYYTVPSVLREELDYNVFMRCRTESIQKIVGSEDPVACIGFLREFKNTGAKPKL